jgi:hypothetical protein
MEMIDRYLQAVKFGLPQTQRDDIIKELRDSILSQVEEKEAALGRPMSVDEQVELLQKLGRPMHLASRYRKQQYMIGGAMFPHLLESVESLAGPRVSRACGRQYRDRGRGQIVF